MAWLLGCWFAWLLAGWLACLLGLLALFTLRLGRADAGPLSTSFGYYDASEIHELHDT